MTISSYQIDNILKAYSKQDRVKVRQPAVKDAAYCDRYMDTVSLSSGKDKAMIYNKISYSLLDVLIKGAHED
jgi:hypothetical protein